MMTRIKDRMGLRLSPNHPGNSGREFVAGEVDGDAEDEVTIVRRVVSKSLHPDKIRPKITRSLSPGSRMHQDRRKAKSAKKIRPSSESVFNVTASPVTMVLWGWINSGLFALCHFIKFVFSCYEFVFWVFGIGKSSTVTLTWREWLWFSANKRILEGLAVVTEDGSLFASNTEDSITDRSKNIPRWSVYKSPLLIRSGFESMDPKIPWDAQQTLTLLVSRGHLFADRFAVLTSDGYVLVLHRLRRVPESVRSQMISLDDTSLWRSATILLDVVLLRFLGPLCSIVASTFGLLIQTQLPETTSRGHAISSLVPFNSTACGSSLVADIRGESPGAFVATETTFSMLRRALSNVVQFTSDRVPLMIQDDEHLILSSDDPPARLNADERKTSAENEIGSSELPFASDTDSFVIRQSNCRSLEGFEDAVCEEETKKTETEDLWDKRFIRKNIKGKSSSSDSSEGLLMTQRRNQYIENERLNDVCDVHGIDDLAEDDDASFETATSKQLISHASSPSWSPNDFHSHLPVRNKKIKDTLSPNDPSPQHTPVPVLFQHGLLESSLNWVMPGAPLDTSRSVWHPAETFKVFCRYFSRRVPVSSSFVPESDSLLADENLLSNLSSADKEGCRIYSGFSDASSFKKTIIDKDVTMKRIPSSRCASALSEHKRVGQLTQEIWEKKWTLPIALAMDEDKKYDVWLSNSRGNLFSKRLHKGRSSILFNRWISRSSILQKCRNIIVGARCRGERGLNAFIQDFSEYSETLNSEWTYNDLAIRDLEAVFREMLISCSPANTNHQTTSSYEVFRNDGQEIRNVEKKRKRSAELSGMVIQTRRGSSKYHSSSHKPRNRYCNSDDEIPKQQRRQNLMRVRSLNNDYSNQSVLRPILVGVSQGACTFLLATALGDAMRKNASQYSSSFDKVASIDSPEGLAVLGNAIVSLCGISSSLRRIQPSALVMFSPPVFAACHHVSAIGRMELDSLRPSEKSPPSNCCATTPSSLITKGLDSGITVVSALNSTAILPEGSSVPVGSSSAQGWSSRFGQINSDEECVTLDKKCQSVFDQSRRSIVSVVSQLWHYLKSDPSLSDPLKILLAKLKDSQAMAARCAVPLFLLLVKQYLTLVSFFVESALMILPPRLVSVVSQFIVQKLFKFQICPMGPAASRFVYKHTPNGITSKQNLNLYITRMTSRTPLSLPLSMIFAPSPSSGLMDQTAFLDPSLLPGLPATDVNSIRSTTDAGGNLPTETTTKALSGCDSLETSSDDWVGSETDKGASSSSLESLGLSLSSPTTIASVYGLRPGVKIRSTDSNDTSLFSFFSGLYPLASKLKPFLSEWVKHLNTVSETVTQRDSKLLDEDLVEKKSVTEMSLLEIGSKRTDSRLENTADIRGTTPNVSGNDDCICQTQKDHLTSPVSNTYDECLKNMLLKVESKGIDILKLSSCCHLAVWLGAKDNLVDTKRTAEYFLKGCPFAQLVMIEPRQAPLPPLLHHLQPSRSHFDKMTTAQCDESSKSLKVFWHPSMSHLDFTWSLQAMVDVLPQAVVEVEAVAKSLLSHSNTSSLCP